MDGKHGNGRTSLKASNQSDAPFSSWFCFHQLLKSDNFCLQKPRELAIRRSRKAFNPVDAKLHPKLLYTPLLEVRFSLLVLSIHLTISQPHF
jgi:hypothetical protein